MRTVAFQVPTELFEQLKAYLKRNGIKQNAFFLDCIRQALAEDTGAAALKKACEQGLIGKDATVVSVVTGNGLKDVANAIKSAGEPLHIEPDLDLMVEGFAQRGVTVE